MIINRPVLLWPNRSIITFKQMKSIMFDFEVTEVFKCGLITNARNVEDEIQSRLQQFELGSRRLHRFIRKGERYPDKLGKPRCHRVFITTSAKVPDLIKAGTIIVNV